MKKHISMATVATLVFTLLAGMLVGTASAAQMEQELVLGSGESAMTLNTQEVIYAFDDFADSGSWLWNGAEESATLSKENGRGIVEFTKTSSKNGILKLCDMGSKGIALGEDTLAVGFRLTITDMTGASQWDCIRFLPSVQIANSTSESDAGVFLGTPGAPVYLIDNEGNITTQYITDEDNDVIRFMDNVDVQLIIPLSSLKNSAGETLDQRKDLLKDTTATYRRLRIGLVKPKQSKLAFSDVTCYGYEAESGEENTKPVVDLEKAAVALGEGAPVNKLLPIENLWDCSAAQSGNAISVGANPWSGTSGTKAAFADGKLALTYGGDDNAVLRLIYTTLGESYAIGVRMQTTDAITAEVMFRDENKGKNIDSIPGKTVYLFTAEGTTAQVLDSDGNFTLPSNFDGILICPFDAVFTDETKPAKNDSVSLRIAAKQAPKTTVYYDEVIRYQVASEAPYNASETLQNFNGLTQMPDGFSCWNGSVTTANFSIESGMLKATGEITSGAMFSIPVDGPGTLYKAASVHVDTSALDTAVKLTFRMVNRANTSKAAFIAVGSTYYLQPDDVQSGEVVQGTADSNSSVTLPLHFVGDIIIPIESYAAESFPLEEIQTAEQVSFQVGINTAISADKAICFDDVSYLRNALKFSGASLTLQNNIQINFAVKKTLIDGGNYNNFSAEFSMNGNSVTVDTYTEQDEYYIFSYPGVLPSKMADTVTATLHAEAADGTPCSSEAVEYSVLEYCNSMLTDKADNEKLRTLIVDLMNYGATSQLYKGYKTDALVNAGLTAEQKAWASAAPTLEDGRNLTQATVETPAASWVGATLNLKDSVALQYWLQVDGDISDISVEIAIDGGKSVTVAGEDMTKNGEYYIVEFDGLTAAQMSTPVDITVKRGGVAISNTLRYSVESYAYSKQNDDSVPHLADLVKAMMQYGNSASQYR